jgi:hypothetical protein
MKKEQELRKVKRKINPIFAKGLSVIGKIREMGVSLSFKFENRVRGFEDSRVQVV